MKARLALFLGQENARRAFCCQSKVSGVSSACFN